MDKEKNPNQTGNTNNKEEKQKPAEVSSWKRVLSKKWVYPAVYLGAAALILALIVWFQVQSPDKYSIDQDDLLPDVVNNQGDGVASGTDSTVTVNTPEENLDWPVAKDSGAQIARGFYDDQASEEDKAKTVFQYSNTIYPNTGLDLTIDGTTSFDILAAASGEVIRAEKDPVVGNLVEIKHSEDRITVYQSLGDFQVAVGDKVEKGQKIGTAGRNAIGKDLGVHLHFEVHNKDRVPMNPVTYLPQQN